MTIESTVFIVVCRAKLNRAPVTFSSPDYVGSLTVDEEILERLGVHKYEKVLVVNRTNGNRFETYVLPGQRGKREIGLNGGAALLGKVGDIVGFVAFATIAEAAAVNFKPKVIELDSDGRIVDIEQD